MHLVGGGDGEHGAGRAGARRATRAVHVGLVLHRRIGVHNEGHLVHVNAARRDVGGHKGRGSAAREGVEVLRAGVLREVAVQLDGGETVGRQPLGELLGPVLRAGEHQDAVATGEAGHDRDPVGVVHDDDVVGHLDRRLGGDGVRHRVVHVLAHDLVDTAGERGREQQTLPLLRRAVHQAAHRRQEADVGHVVGFVEHGDLDGTEVERTRAEVVGQAAGAPDDDLGTGAQRGDLWRRADATEHGGRAQARSGSERLDDGLHLRRQLTGGHEHKRSRAAVTDGPLGVHQPGDDRQGEGERLARTGTALTEHVTAAQGVGQGGCLDRERREQALAGERLAQRVGYTELGEAARSGRHVDRREGDAGRRRSGALGRAALGEPAAIARLLTTVAAARLWAAVAVAGRLAAVAVGGRRLRTAGVARGLVTSAVRRAAACTRAAGRGRGGRHENSCVAAGPLSRQ